MEVVLCFQFWGGWCVVVSWLVFVVETRCYNIYFLKKQLTIQVLPGDPFGNFKLPFEVILSNFHLGDAYNQYGQHRQKKFQTSRKC